MWSIARERLIDAPASTVWRRYLDAETWHEWAHNTEAARFDRPLELGVVGRVKPLTGPEQEVRVVAFEDGRLLATEARPPGARMSFRYEVTPGASGSRVRHSIAMTGALAGAYGLLLRRRNERQLGEELERLARTVEADAVSR